MATLASFLMAITGSLAARVLTSLGIGFLSYAALNTLAASVVSHITTNYNGMGSVPLALINLAGGGQVLGILCAALITRASLIAIKRLSPL